jgi:hypothetical protein
MIAFSRSTLLYGVTYFKELLVVVCFHGKVKFLLLKRHALTDGRWQKRFLSLIFRNARIVLRVSYDLLLQNPGLLRIHDHFPTSFNVINV